MQTPSRSEAPSSSPVEVARLAIWRLFEEGYVDEDMATAGLLAVDLGTRRTSAQNRRAPYELTRRESSRRVA